jgi:hypothetical protein
VSHGPERKAEGRGGLPLAVAGEQEQQALFSDFFVVHTLMNPQKHKNTQPMAKHKSSKYKAWWCRPRAGVQKVRRALAEPATTQ